MAQGFEKVDIKDNGPGNTKALSWRLQDLFPMD